MAIIYLSPTEGELQGQKIYNLIVFGGYPKQQQLQTIVSVAAVAVIYRYVY